MGMVAFVPSFVHYILRYACFQERSSFSMAVFTRVHTVLLTERACGQADANLSQEKAHS